MKQGENRRVILDKFGTDSVGAKLSETMARSRERRTVIEEKRAAKRGQLPAKTPSIFKIWISALQETFPDRHALTLSNKQFHILSGIEKRYRNQGREDFKTLFNWCLRNWEAILDDGFSFMKGVRPTYPNVSFFVKCLPTFEAAYADRQAFEARAKKTHREILIDKAMAKGKDRETAERTADQFLGLSKLRKEVEAKLALVKQFHSRPPVVEPDPNFLPVKVDPGLKLHHAHLDSKKKIPGPYPPFRDY